MPSTSNLGKQCEERQRHPNEEMRVHKRHDMLSPVGIWEEKQSRRMLNMIECIVFSVEVLMNQKAGGSKEQQVQSPCNVCFVSLRNR